VLHHLHQMPTEATGRVDLLDGLAQNGQSVLKVLRCLDRDARYDLAKLSDGVLDGVTVRNDA